jgi:hypothetical protein
MRPPIRLVAAAIALVCVAAHARIPPGLGATMNRSFLEANAELEARRLPLTAQAHAREAYRRAMLKQELPEWVHSYYRFWIAEAGRVDLGQIDLDTMFRTTDLELRRLGQMELSRLREIDHQSQERMNELYRQQQTPIISVPPQITCETTRFGSISTTTCR